MGSCRREHCWRETNGGEADVGSKPFVKGERGAEGGLVTDIRDTME